MKCKLYKQCGSCAYLDLDYKLQLEKKKNYVTDLFKKEKASEITAKKIKKIIESQTYNNINNQGMRAVKQQLQNAENNLQLFRDNEKAFELQQEIILKCQELQDLLRKEEKR